MFFFQLWLQNQNQRRLRGWNIKGSHWWVSNSWTINTNILRTVLSWETDWIPYSIRIRNEVTTKLRSNTSYPKQWTVLALKTRSPKRPLQLWQTVSSSVSLLTLPNSLVWFWILYLWEKCNPKHSILQINAVNFVYVESCYKILHQHTKNRIIVLIFSINPTYPLIKCVSFLKNEVNDTVPKESTIDMFIKTFWEKYGANVLTLC